MKNSKGRSLGKALFTPTPIPALGKVKDISKYAAIMEDESLIYWDDQKFIPYQRVNSLLELSQNINGSWFFRLMGLSGSGQSRSLKAICEYIKKAKSNIY